MNKAHIALCMLVHDDEATIDQTLASALPLIDYWVICDAGSTDATSKLVTQTLAGLPGELHTQEWVDFGVNRSELMERAHGKADYLLLLEPGTIVSRTGPLPELVADAYVVGTASGDGADAIPRLVRGSKQWWFEGSTHEAIATNGRFSQEPLHELSIGSIAAPDLKRRTLQRQLDILEREIASAPPTRRNTFLLAETLRQLGRNWAAVEWYRRRVEFDDIDEATFYSTLQMAVLRPAKDFLSAVPILLEAWQRRPTRAEPLYELARGYHLREDPGLTMLFANFGLQIPRPADSLYVQDWIYEWGLRLERAWAAGRLGDIASAEEDLSAVLRCERLPEQYREIAQDWFDSLGDDGLALGEAIPGKPPAHRPPTLTQLAEGARVGRIELAVEDDWATFNPSIAVDGDGFRMIVRSENVRFARGNVRFDERIHRNVSYLVKLDRSLAIHSVERIDEDPDGFQRHDAHITGFMDLRLISLNGAWLASGSSWQLSPGRDSSELALLNLDNARVTHIQRLGGPDPSRREKNWMPFVHDGVLHYVYACWPLVIYRFDPHTGVTQVAESETPPVASQFRGSSQGIPLDDGGYLFVVHEMYHQAKRRSYVHRFIRIGADLRLGGISRPFTFTDEVREFCCGAARQGSELVLSFGVRHTEAWLATLPLDVALGLLEEVDQEVSGSLRA